MSNEERGRQLGEWTGMSDLQNQIQYKNLILIVITFFLCDVIIGRNICLKLQKVD